MSLDKVKEEIRQEAEAKAEKLIEEAEEEAENRIEEAEEEAERIKEEAREKAEERKEALKEREISAARREAKRKELDAKNDVIEEAFQRFREQIASIDKDRKEELFTAALEILDGFDIGRIETSDEMVDGLADETDADVEAADVEGLVVESADGSVRHDFSFDTVIGNVMEETRRDVADTIFGQ